MKKWKISSCARDGWMLSGDAEKKLEDGGRKDGDERKISQISLE